MARKDRGYTIIEGMVAISILLLGVAAAASLSMTLTNQEEINAKNSRALSVLENSGRLFQLGLTATEVQAIIPPLPEMVSLGFTTNAETVTGVGSVDVTTITVTYSPDPNGNLGTAHQRQSSVSVIRPQP